MAYRLASDFVPFADLPGSGRFSTGAVQPLVSTLSAFLGGGVGYSGDAVGYARRRYGINLRNNPSRGVYPISDREVLVFVRVLRGNELVSGVCLRLYQQDFSGLGRLLTELEGALSRSLTHAWERNFREVPFGFGPDLLELTISNFCSKGWFSSQSFRFLIKELLKLASSTFENEPYTTGLLLTRAYHEYAANEEQGGRLGTVRNLDAGLHKTIRYVPRLDRRFWFLVDGVRTFYMADQYLRIRHLYEAPSTSNEEGLVHKRTFRAILRGGDAVLRVLGKNEVAITNARGLEFYHDGNAWRLRDFPRLIADIRSATGVSESTGEALLAKALSLASQRRSALLVVPKSIRNAVRTMRVRHRFVRDPIPLDRWDAGVDRLLASDGATILDQEGQIRYFGCVVESRLEQGGPVRGTGETAAATLGKLGVALKVSADGVVKVYGASERSPFLL